MKTILSLILSYVNGIWIFLHDLFGTINDIYKNGIYFKQLTKEKILSSKLHEEIKIVESDLFQTKYPIMICGESKYMIFESRSFEPKKLHFRRLHDFVLNTTVLKRKKKWFLFNITLYILEIRILKAGIKKIKISPLNLIVKMQCIPSRIEKSKTILSHINLNGIDNIDVQNETILGRPLSVICTRNQFMFKLLFLDQFNNQVLVQNDTIFHHLLVKSQWDETILFDISIDQYAIIQARHDYKTITIYWNEYEVSAISLFYIDHSYIDHSSKKNQINCHYHKVNISIIEYQKYFKDAWHGLTWIEQSMNNKEMNVYLSLDDRKSIKVVYYSWYVLKKTLCHWNKNIHFRFLRAIEGKYYCLLGTLNDIALVSFKSESDMHFTALLIFESMHEKKTIRNVSDVHMIQNGALISSLKPKHMELTVNRHNLISSYSQFFKMLSNKFNFDVKFMNEIGFDMGGLTKEYFTLWNDLLFSKESGIFAPLSENSSSFHFVNDFAEETKTIKALGGRSKAAEFAGMFIARILIYCSCKKEKFVPIPVLLSKTLRLHLLGINPDTLCIQHDHVDLWAHTFTYIMRNDPAPLELTFDVDVFDPIIEKHLFTKNLNHSNKSGQVKVTNQNKYLFLDLLADWTLNKSCEKQIKSFKDGFRKTVDLNSMTLSETDIEELICSSNEIDVDNLIEFSEFDECVQIEWLWKVLRSLSKEEKSRFLHFVTGSTHFPMGGAKNLHPKLKIALEHDQNKLPTSQTCFNKLTLPSYESYDDLKKKIMICINDGYNGFGLA